MTELLGLIVNPVAGLGGRVGLKGTDGAETVRRARELGAEPIAPERAARALRRLNRVRDRIELLCAAGAMGAEVAQARDLHTEVIHVGGSYETSAADTRAAAAVMERRRVALILFAGGDGTTRDIVDEVGTRVPILGIPTGVKMQSGVFATTPEAAGDVALAYLVSDLPVSREGEVLDIDEDALRDGHLSARLYGLARVPDDQRRVQHPKAGSFPADAALDALCRRLADELHHLTLVGPGSTMQRVLSHRGIEGSMLGVDAVEDGRLVGRDLNEAQLLELTHARAARLLIGVVGGQGFLFGRGNQQLSPRVIRRVGPENIEIVASLDKLLALNPPKLHLDTGDPELDRLLSGYRRVRVAPDRYLVFDVSA